MSNIKEKLRKLEEGDLVKIVSNIPFQLKDKPRPIIGTITNIDGGYILVKPKGCEWVAEFYRGEIRSLMREEIDEMIKQDRNKKIDGILSNDNT